MILVTLGTQDKSFKRLLESIEKEIINKNIKEEVIVQAGHTKYESDKMKIFDFISPDEMNKLIKDCNLLITHAGIGSILNAIKQNKKVIVAARLKKYKEHTNDHQLQILNEFAKSNYIIPLFDLNKLDEALLKVKTFKPNKYKSNTENFVNLIEKEIEKLGGINK